MHEHVGDLDAMLGECVPRSPGAEWLRLRTRLARQSLSATRRPPFSHARSFHNEVQNEITKWRRWDRAGSMSGDAGALPHGLIITVGVDGFIDGFLIGARRSRSPPALQRHLYLLRRRRRRVTVDACKPLRAAVVERWVVVMRCFCFPAAGVTCILSAHGGVILALATCIEMCFLGESRHICHPRRMVLRTADCGCAGVSSLVPRRRLPQALRTRPPCGASLASPRSSAPSTSCSRASCCSWAPWSALLSGCGIVSPVISSVCSCCTHNASHAGQTVSLRPVSFGAAHTTSQDVSESNPAVFAAFLAFGVVALLFLVTHELLIEAHESTKSELWWVNIWLFLGMLLVLELNRVIPGGG